MRFFNRITLQTPESVELEITLAGIGNRAWALILDYLIAGCLFFAFFIIWLIFAVEFINWIEIVVGTDNLELWLWGLLIFVSSFTYIGYFVIFETLWQGQTPGKRLAKIRVIRDDGRPVGLQQATLRALLRIVDDTLFIGALLILFTRLEKRLGDMVAGTLVVQAEQPVAAATFPVSEAAKNLAQQLPQISDFYALLPDDFAVIREFLQRRDGMESEARADLSRQLTRQVKDLIALEKVPVKVSAEDFLEAVYLAYQQQSK